MEIRPFCVYNKTNESFLSLDVTLAGGFGEWFREWMGWTPRSGSEGRWITRLGGVRTLGLFSSRDLIYLDSTLTILTIVEDLPALRVAPSIPGTVSILELPLHSVASSGTRVGHQLVICAADEMESKLRSMLRPGANIAQTFSNKGGLRERLAEVRRVTRRVRWPRLIAYNGDKTTQALHEVRDISAGGLYLMTGERWPVGSHIRMTLQRSDGPDGDVDDTMPPVVVDLLVARWGTDGMGLEFAQVDTEQTALVAMHVR
jgi:hypothetical protein